MEFYHLQIEAYTMFGQGGEIPTINDSSSLSADLGLAPRVACELFRLVEDRKTSFHVKVEMNMFEVRISIKLKILFYN